MLGDEAPNSGAELSAMQAMQIYCGKRNSLHVDSSV